MAAPPNPAQEWALTVPLKFYGMPTPKDGLAPATFLRELTARKVKHNWTDAQVMPYMESCMDREAEAWFQSRVKSRTREFAVAADAPANNFEAFKLMFKQHYLLGGKTYRPNWSIILHQQKDEATSSYLSRSFNALHTWLEASAEDVTPTVPVADMQAIVAQRLNLANLIGINNDNQAARVAGIVGQVAGSVQAEHTRIMQVTIAEFHANLYDYLGKSMLFDGLRNPEQKRLAHRLLDEEKPINDVIDLLHSFSLKHSASAHLHSVDIFPGDSTDDSHEVGAAGTSGRGRGRGRGRGGRGGSGGTGAPRTAVPGGPCSFCGAKAHVTKDCPQRATCLRFGPQIVAEMQQQKARKVAAAAPDPAPLMATPVANPDAMWSAQAGNATGWQ